MNEEIKITATELSDEEIENAVGGKGNATVTGECPNCGVKFKLDLIPGVSFPPCQSCSYNLDEYLTPLLRIDASDFRCL